jgi:hypothetical protein
VKQGAGILRRLQEQDVVVLLRHVVAEGAIAWGDQVRVGAHEAGKDRSLRIISPLDGDAIGHPHIGLATQADDAVALDEHRRLLDGSAAGPIEEARGGDQGEARRDAGHVVSAGR